MQVTSRILGAVAELRVFGVGGIGEIRPGDDVAALLLEALDGRGAALEDGDVVVVTSKAVSKAEGRLVRLDSVTPSQDALELTGVSGRDPRLVEIALRETARAVRKTRGVLISETRHGFVCANAGVDASNLESAEVAALLPVDPDASARRIRDAIQQRTGRTVAVILSDTFGRAWRNGQTNVAIGVAGISALRDYRGQVDSAGLTLVVTEIAVVDELAGAAELVMGKLDRVPVAVVRGYEFEPTLGAIRDLIRPAELDFFR
ncbi:MAG: coenzyme F420-0:L-glutamate ligase [Chloroflexota bacterium]